MQAFIQGMLMDNGGCEFPCWWGITPGDTTLQVLRDRFNGISAGSIHYSRSAPNGKEDYNVHVGFKNQDDTIITIKVDTTAYSDSPTRYFIQDWSRFSLAQILTHYGVPSYAEIRLKDPLHPHSQPFYVLAVVYEQHGFSIQYLGDATFDGKIVKTCPNLKGIVGIRLNLQSPKANVPVFQPDLQNSRPIEEITGMDLNTFYETFKDGSGQSCLAGTPTDR